MANPIKAKQPTSTTGLVEIIKRKQALQLELEKLQQEETELARKSAEQIKRDVQIQLEELSQQIAPLIAQGVWNWRSGEFDQALETMELSPEGPAPVVVSDEFKKRVLEALGSEAVSLAGVAAKLGEAKPNNIRLRMNQLVSDGVLKSKDDPGHSGKGRAPKLFLKA